jgi:hypothetical protein
MPRLLEAAQGQKWHQRADVQAVGGRVKAAVEGLGTTVEPLAEGIAPGHLENKLPGLKIGNQRVGHGVKNWNGERAVKYPTIMAFPPTMTEAVQPPQELAYSFEIKQLANEHAETSN